MKPRSHLIKHCWKNARDLVLAPIFSATQVSAEKDSQKETDTANFGQIDDLIMQPGSERSPALGTQVFLPVVDRQVM